MKYIDVDNDKRTFSSSEATIYNTNESPKIAYAALYWSALYPFKTGVLRKSGNKMEYKGLEERDPEVNSVFLKTPNDEYRMIKGQTIFDSNNNDVFTTNIPYVCFADVTSLLQSMPSINGTYTVANIKATEGEIFGGGAAGWLLYIVYEDPNESPKYFTTYNGLVGISSEPLEIAFKNFKIKKNEPIKTSIAIGALEGDGTLKNDEVSVYNITKEKYSSLSNSIRKKGNFFNSSITMGDSLFTFRNPNSSNTLGFDMLKMQIPNKKNEIINSATTEVKFKFESKEDHYYLFFMAFETEIDNLFYNEKYKLAQLEIFKKNQLLKEANVIKEDPYSFSIPNEEKGYYLVTNFFSIPEQKSEWIDLLTEKGYNPKVFVNPKNNLQYVYLLNDKDQSVVLNKMKELKDLVGFKGLEIYKINIEEK
jgi:hypothetical protein